MLRTSSSVITKAKASAKPSKAMVKSLSANSSPTAAPLAPSMHSMNMLSPIDGPMYVPECDDGGGENEQSDTTAKPVATATTTTTNGKWLSSLLRPQPGTNAYNLLYTTDAGKADVAPGFLQRVVFGTAEYLLDKAASTESSMKSVQIRTSKQVAISKMGLLHSTYYGVPAEVLDAKVVETKVTVTAVKVSKIEDEVDKLQEEAEKQEVASEDQEDEKLSDIVDNAYETTSDSVIPARSRNLGIGLE